MNADSIRELLARHFAEVTLTGRLEPELPGASAARRAAAPRAAWWFAGDGCVAECLAKWTRAQRPETTAATSLEVTTYGAGSAALKRAAAGLLAEAEREKRSHYGGATYRIGDSTLRVIDGESGPAETHSDAKFARLRALVLDASQPFDDMTKAIELLARERSQRTIEVLLESKTLYALDRLSAWGVQAAREPLDALLEQLSASGDRMSIRVLMARHRLDAWAAAGSAS